MPKLDKDSRVSKKIILKASSQPNDEAWVEIYEDVLTGDVMGVGQFEENKMMASLAAITNLIKDWNFTDKDGNKSEISIETVKLLPFEDMMQLISEVKAFDKFQGLTEIKKNK